MRYPNYLGCCMWPIGLYLTGNRNRDLGIKYGDQVPRSRNFEFLTFRLPPVLWPTFFMHSDKRVSWHTMHKMLGRSTLKQTPKLRVWKFLGAWHILTLPPLGDDTPHFTRAYYRPKYADKNSFFYSEPYCFPFDWDMKFQSFIMLEIWPGSVPKFGPGEGDKYLEIFGWVHGPRHLAARVYNAHWQSFIRMGGCK